jgi:hypothetical protein
MGECRVVGHGRSQRSLLSPKTRLGRIFNKPRLIDAMLRQTLKFVLPEAQQPLRRDCTAMAVWTGSTSMGQDAIIRRKNREPLGTGAEVMERLSLAFPNVKFVSEENGQWSGAFEGNGLAIEFQLGAEGLVREVAIFMRGDLNRIFDHLAPLGDWLVDTGLSQI